MEKSTHTVELDAAALAGTCPFILLLDGELRVVWASAALRRRFGGDPAGRGVRDVLALPGNASAQESLERFQRTPAASGFQLRTARGLLPLRLACIPASRTAGFLLLAAVDVHALEQLVEFDLDIEDFAQHDPALAKLVLNDELRASLRDATAACEQLRKNSQDLSRSNQELDASLHKLAEEIAERRRAEEALQEAKEAAEAANRLKSAFLANMSHEIRTPMTAILGYAELLTEKLPNDDEGQGYLDIIQRSGQFLLELINDILDLSKIESGQAQAERILCSPVEILDEVLLVTAVRAREKGLAIAENLESDIPERIVSDPTRLKQALINLVANAIKFTDVGSVTISARWVPVEEGRGHLQFRVRDTGIGIPPGKIDGIFKPFHQVDPSTSRKYGGTGLGLWISYRIVQMLGGELAVQSEEGLGTLFTLTVPCEVPPGTGFVRGSPSRKPRSVRIKRQPPATELAGSILLVEDDEEIQNLVRFLLEKFGAQVQVAVNGAEAIEMCSRARFDLIILDIVMPEMNGFETLKRLQMSGIAVPVIALTAHVMKGDRERCLDAGFSAYLPKPIKIEDFVATVEAFLRTGSRQRARLHPSRHATK